MFVKRWKMRRGPCVLCDTGANIEAHHVDYKQPMLVVWLCRDHHSMVTQEFISLEEKGIKPVDLREVLSDTHIREEEERRRKLRLTLPGDPSDRFRALFPRAQ
jgi:hypothetical protein